MEEEIDSTILGMEENTLARVISNLVNNSIEALDEEKKEQGEIVLSADWHGGSNSFLCIKVNDNGPGVPPQVLGKLGEDSISSKRQKGYGLGLVGAKRALTAIGGELKVFSWPGMGTEVHVIIPVA